MYEMERPQGNGTPSTAGYCKRQPSTKQQRVVTVCQAPAESSLSGLCLGGAGPGGGRAAGSWKGAALWEVREQTVKMRGGKARRGGAFPKVISNLVVPPHRAGKEKELNKVIIC